MERPKVEFMEALLEFFNEEKKINRGTFYGELCQRISKELILIIEVMTGGPRNIVI